jgi:colicin import membrane protein
MNVVHNVKSGGTVKGNAKGSWMQLEFAGEEISFEQFVQINVDYPRIFEPAFRLQQLMMIYTMGEVWWTLKKRELLDMKEDADAKIAKAKEKKEAKKQAKKDRAIRRNMGVIKYYFCPCYRDFYDPAKSQHAHLTAEEKKQREMELALKKRQAELRLKNPETADWLKFQKKLEEEQAAYEAATKAAKEQAAANRAIALGKKPGTIDEEEEEKEEEEQPKKKVVNFLEEKLQTTARPREERAMNRADRKKQRKYLENEPF